LSHKNKSEDAIAKFLLYKISASTIKR